MVEVTSPIKGTYLVHAQRPPWGKSEVSGIAVYHFRNGTWLCERCGAPQNTSRGDCLHVLFVKKTL
jgi:frataxin-like iron-binding protein CyaY